MLQMIWTANRRLKSLASSMPKTLPLLRPWRAFCRRSREAIDLVTAALRRGGRLIYVGAGTSGRIGALDAAECPPTFNTDPRSVQFIIAGGFAALASDF